MAWLLNLLSKLSIYRTAGGVEPAYFHIIQIEADVVVAGLVGLVNRECCCFWMNGNIVHFIAPVYSWQEYFVVFGIVDIVGNEQFIVNSLGNKGVDDEYRSIPRLIYICNDGVPLSMVVACLLEYDIGCGAGIVSPFRF